MRWRQSPLENENGNEEQGGPLEIGIELILGNGVCVCWWWGGCPNCSGSLLTVYCSQNLYVESDCRDKNPGYRLSVSVKLLIDLVVYLIKRLRGLMMSIRDFCECGEALERHFGQFCICPLAHLHKQYQLFPIHLTMLVLE